MEKSLTDKIRNHTADDIDKEMILARLKCAHGDLENILAELSELLDRLHKLCADKKTK